MRNPQLNAHGELTHLLSLEGLPADVIRTLDRCRIIARYGIGVDTIDVDAANERGIVVTVPASRSGRAHGERQAAAFLVEREPWVRRHLADQAELVARVRARGQWPGAMASMWRPWLAPAPTAWSSSATCAPPRA